MGNRASCVACSSWRKKSSAFSKVKSKDNPVKNLKGKEKQDEGKEKSEGENFSNVTAVILKLVMKQLDEVSNKYCRSREIKNYVIVIFLAYLLINI